MAVIQQVLEDHTHLKRIKEWLEENEIHSDCAPPVVDPKTFESIAFINILNEEDITLYHLKWGA